MGKKVSELYKILQSTCFQALFCEKNGQELLSLLMTVSLLMNIMINVATFDCVTRRKYVSPK